MKDAVEKRDAEETRHRGTVLLARPDEARQRTIEGRLLCKDPAREARCRHGTGRMRGSERRGRRRYDIKCTDDEDRHQYGQDNTTRSGHGHFTRILLAKVSP